MGGEGTWKTLTTRMGGVDFVVEDDTDRVAVDPTGANVHLDLVDSRVGDGDALPAFVISDTDQRGTAWRIARPALGKVLIGLNALGIVVVIGGLFLM